MVLRAERQVESLGRKGAAGVDAAQTRLMLTAAALNSYATELHFEDGKFFTVTGGRRSRTQAWVGTISLPLEGRYPLPPLERADPLSSDIGEDGRSSAESTIDSSGAKITDSVFHTLTVGNPCRMVRLVSKRNGV